MVAQDQEDDDLASFPPLLRSGIASSGTVGVAYCTGEGGCKCTSSLRTMRKMQPTIPRNRGRPARRALSSVWMSSFSRSIGATTVCTTTSITAPAALCPCPSGSPPTPIFQPPPSTFPQDLS